MVGCVAAINVNALCPYGIAAESERTSLRAQAAGRGTPGRESWAARDRTESGTHRAGEGASVRHSQLSTTHGHPGRTTEHGGSVQDFGGDTPEN